jgi:DNA-binding GntR family transcriptional regulator
MISTFSEDLLMEETVSFSLKPAPRQTLGENVAASLREAIFGGHFEPGQRLAEASLATTLKVSRAPVREALASLEQEGLVNRALNRGKTVINLCRNDVEEICSLRLPLEVLAVRQVIKHGTGEHWAELVANVRETEKACTPKQLTALDLQFHETLIRSAGHGRLLNTWLGLRSQIRLLMMRRNLSDSDSRRVTVQGHNELLEAIRERDEPRALDIVEKHQQRQYDWLIEAFDEAEAAG